jgi:FlgD Ig-like domain
VRILIISVCMLLASISIATAQTNLQVSEQPDDVYWSKDFQSPWLFDYWLMTAVDTFGSTVIFAGFFNSGGSEVTSRIVGWDGAKWFNFGEGLQGLIYCVSEFRDKLTVAGTVIATDSGGELGSIAQWDGVQWNVLPGQVHGTIYALQPWKDKLWFAGDFDSIPGLPCVDFACWDGSNWLCPGVGTTNLASSMTRLAIYKDNLILAGSFDSIGGVACRKIALWDGIQVKPLSTGISGSISALYPDGGELIIGGAIDSAGGSVCRNLAKWDGTDWRSFGSGANKGVTGFERWSGGLVVSGEFDSIGNVAANRVALYNSGVWSAIGSGLPKGVMKIVAKGDSLAACGIFPGTHPMYQHHIEVWSEGRWDTIRGAGADAPVYALGSIGDTLYVGGQFLVLGNKVMNQIAQLGSNNEWSTLDTGIYSHEGGGITDFENYRGDLIVSGVFVSSPSSSWNEIRKWDGEQWYPIGENEKMGTCKKIQVYDDKLFALGRLYLFGGNDDSTLLASWDGESWSKIDFLPQPFWYAAQELAELATHDGELIVGGHFDSVSGIAAKNLVGWNGSTWHAFGNPEDYHGPQRISAVISFHGQLVAGGKDWPPQNSASEWSVARWDGSSWHPLGSQFTAKPNEWGSFCGVSALEEFNGQLYAAGSFDSIGGEPINNIAVWNGDRWLPLGSGITKTLNIGGFADFMPVIVNDLHAHNNRLYVGGDFTQAGTHVSFGLASWSKGISVDVPETPPSQVIPESFLLQQNYPNPFNLSTTIRFSLPRKSEVTCEVHNLLGQRVRRLLSATLSAGSHELTWDGMNDGGEEVASGIYFYEFTVGETKQSRKMVLLK